MTSMGTSRVIETLQLEIDGLKRDLMETKATLNETKQKYSILQKRNETMVEQLSNAKHQAEVAESMLKRKERRVLDLELQLTDSMSNYDSIKFEHDKLKSNLSTINNDKLHFEAENERLDTAYQMIQNSFKQYKINMNNKIDDLQRKIPQFINDRERVLNDNINLLKSQQPELSSTYNIFVKNSKRLEQLYSTKYEKVNDSLIALAKSTKQHGESTSIILEECEEILKKLNRNEDVLLKIENGTDGPLTNIEKMEQFKKIRDISILTDSTNVTNNEKLMRLSSPSSLSSLSASASASTSSKYSNSVDTPLENHKIRSNNESGAQRRRISSSNNNGNGHNRRRRNNNNNRNSIHDENMHSRLPSIDGPLQSSRRAPASSSNTNSPYLGGGGNRRNTNSGSGRHRNSSKRASMQFD